MIQLQALNYILENKDSSMITINNLNDEFFSDYKDQFNFIQDHLNKYGQIPDKATFLVKFPDFDIVDVKESSSFIIDELYADKNKRTMANIFKQVREYLINDNTEEAMKLFASSSDIMSKAMHMDSFDIINNSESRYDEFIKRSQDFGEAYVDTGFPELNSVIGGWDRHEELATIVARTNMGKCLEKGTQILLANGTLKNVENIKAGDEVQSLNRSNKVLALHNGKSNGYKIIQKNGKAFTVSANHILTVMKKMSKVDDLYVLNDIMIEDYLKLSDKEKSLYYLYKPHLDYKERKYKISPYTAGVRISDKIPLCYMTGSKNQRFELLAGIIDMYGKFNITHTKYRIALKSKLLINQIGQLCAGLGFKVSQSRKTLYGKYYIYISGPIQFIPVKFNQGKCKLTNLGFHLNLTKFKIKPVKEIEYYGFMTDGDNRYLLSDNTLTHNTWILLKSAIASALAGLKVGIYSGEMSTTKIGFRIDTLLSHISNTKLTHGNISIENDYKEFLESIKTTLKGSIKVLTPDMIGGPAGVLALRGFVEKDKLDILFIDQHSLLEDDRKAKNSTEKAANISRDLKNLQVIKKIPIITVSQQNRESTENGLNTTLIAQSDRIGQDSTIVLFFENKDNIITLYLVKSRDSANGKKLQYAVNLDEGIFSYIPTEKDALKGEQCEALKDNFNNGTTQGDNVF